MNVVPKKAKKGHLRVGDVISINFNQKVFEGDFKEKERKEGKQNQNIHL